MMDECRNYIQSSMRYHKPYLPTIDLLKLKYGQDPIFHRDNDYCLTKVFVLVFVYIFIGDYVKIMIN